MSSLAPTPTPISARTTRMMVEFTLPLLVAAIGLPLIGGVYLIATGGMTAAAPYSTTQALLLRIVETIPSVLMAVAMFALRRVLIEYERGQFLSTIASTNFQRVGYFALAGIMVQVLGEPTLRLIFVGDWRHLFDSTSFELSLMLFGGLLAMVGTTFANAAAAIKAENDEIV
jgi:hypothetical protein